MLIIIKKKLPCKAFISIEKSSSSDQLVLDIIKPGLGDNKFTSSPELSVKIVEVSLFPLKTSNFLLNCNKNSCLSFSEIGIKWFAGRSYKM